MKILDHGEIKIIDNMGTDIDVVRAARTSHQASDKSGDNPEADAKLLKFLMNSGHNTPFESVVLKFYVKAPIFVFRQWHRHRTQSYSEASARYTVLPEEFYIPEPHLVGKQHPTNKQARVTNYEELTHREQLIIDGMLLAMRVHNKQSFTLYKQMLKNGMPKELARSVLPVSTYSEMFTTINLHNLFGFLWERMHEHAQYEIRVYANAMFELIEPIVPVAAAAFKQKMIDAGRLPNYGVHAVTD